MNILFLYYSSIDPTRGGIQRVTSVLSEYIEGKDHKVFYLSFSKNGIINESRNQYYLPDQSKVLSTINIKFLKDTIRNFNIDILINQNGMDPVMSSLSFHSRDTKCKLITCIHNSLLSQIHHFSTTYTQKARDFHLEFLLPITNLKIVKNILLYFYRIKYTAHYQNVCRNSNKVVLLSDRFNPELSFFLPKGQDISNVCSIPNPVSFTPTEDIDKKHKQILYVGRIDRRQKRTDLLVEIWRRLHANIPDWSLVIVGGGKDLEALQKIAVQEKIKNLTFTGFKDPKDYFRDSAIFLLTSSYEGFGIVLVEAMQFGTVPFAFDSYASARDIIDDGINGKLIDPFDIDAYVEQIQLLTQNKERLQDMARKAQIKALDFSLKVVGSRWVTLFNELTSYPTKVP
jgi:glycosyltransferase involved in cell wall biosynthesis